MEPIQAVVLEHLELTARLYFNSTDLHQLPIIVAYSGGLDSSVLLHACSQLQQQNNITKLAAAHVNHGLQSLNDSWQEHCLAVCQKYQIKLHHKQFDLTNANTTSESHARAARYQYFEQLLDKPAVLLFGHHLDDQVETMLFRMIRGTGVHGLAGIPHSRSLANGWISRPLLEHSRSQLEAYAIQFDLSWVEDPSNQQNHYSRNYLRNQVIPKIQSKWPEFSRSFKQLSELASEQNLLMDEVAAQDIQDLQQANLSLNIEGFNRLSKARQKNLLHYWIRSQVQTSPAAIEVEEAINQLTVSNSKNKSRGGESAIKVKMGQGWLRSFDKHIYFCTSDEPAILTETYQWEDFAQPLTLANGVSLEFMKVAESKPEFNSGLSLSIRKPKQGESVTIRARLGGEVARPSYRTHRTGLKKIFQELKVPAWKRQWLPIIYYNEKIACIPGVFVDQAFRSENNHYQIKIQFDLE